jgi:hypothetical protein
LLRMASQGEDTGAQVWKKRRKFSSKTVDDAFRHGDWKGRRSKRV